MRATQKSALWFLGVLFARRIGLQVIEGAVVLPLLATQILWINLVTDGPPALALGVDPADDGLMDKPPRPVGEPVITAAMWRGIALVGIVMAAGTLAVFDASLPGGFIDHEESWQEAAARELREETRIRVDPESFRLVSVRSSDDGHLLLFCEAPPMSAADLPTFMPNVETMDRVFTREPIELAFPLHTEALREWFARR